MDNQSRKLPWLQLATGLAAAILGAYAGQAIGVSVNTALDGALGEWGEGPAFPGLVIRTLLEILGPCLGATLGVYFTGVRGGHSPSRLRLVQIFLGALAGCSIGWALSYPFGPLFWILLPALLAAAIGTTINSWSLRRPLLALVAALVLCIFPVLLTAFLWSQYSNQPHFSFKASILTQTADGQVDLAPAESMPKGIYSSTHMWLTRSDGKIDIRRTVDLCQARGRAEDGQITVVPVASASGWSAHSGRPDSLSENRLHALARQTVSWGFQRAHLWRGHQIYYRINSLEEATQMATLDVRLVREQDGTIFDGVLSVPVGQARSFLPPGVQVGLRVESVRILQP